MWILLAVFTESVWRQDGERVHLVLNLWTSLYGWMQMDEYDMYSTFLIHIHIHISSSKKSSEFIKSQ